MKIMEVGSRPIKQASSDWFTGTVWQDPIVEAPELARVRALNVTFGPGARTAWHTHPLGQTLQVVSGIGLVGLRNEQPQSIKVDDTVWISPGRRTLAWGDSKQQHNPYSYPRGTEWTRGGMAEKGI
jgi:quercetin dioxygenase-like cupin family protein